MYKPLIILIILGGRHWFWALLRSKHRNKWSKKKVANRVLFDERDE